MWLLCGESIWEKRDVKNDDCYTMPADRQEELQGMYTTLEEIRMFNKIRTCWKSADWIKRISCSLTFFVIFGIFFEGLVLESFRLSMLGYQGFHCLYIVAIICSFFTKKWRLILIAIIGPIVAWALTIGLAEVLWYYLLKWFDIDISYRCM